MGKRSEFSLYEREYNFRPCRTSKISKIIQCSKISLCLPSMGNVDGLTRRSIEIPAIGTLLIASRTIDHKKLFKENKEAIFFDDVNECYKKCILYLKNNKKREQIAKRWIYQSHKN